MGNTVKISYVVKSAYNSYWEDFQHFEVDAVTNTGYRLEVILNNVFDTDNVTIKGKANFSKYRDAINELYSISNRVSNRHKNTTQQLIFLENDSISHLSLVIEYQPTLKDARYISTSFIQSYMDPEVPTCKKYGFYNSKIESDGNNIYLNLKNIDRTKIESLADLKEAFDEFLMEVIGENTMSYSTEYKDGIFRIKNYLDPNDIGFELKNI